MGSHSVCPSASAYFTQHNVAEVHPYRSRGRTVLPFEGQPLGGGWAGALAFSGADLRTAHRSCPRSLVFPLARCRLCPSAAGRRGCFPRQPGLCGTPYPVISASDSCG